MFHFSSCLSILSSKKAFWFKKNNFSLYFNLVKKMSRVDREPHYLHPCPFLLIYRIRRKKTTLGLSLTHFMANRCIEYVMIVIYCMVDEILTTKSARPRSSFFCCIYLRNGIRSWLRLSPLSQNEETYRAQGFTNI